MNAQTKTAKTWPARIDRSGRIVLPADARSVCDWSDGTELVIEKLDDNSLRLLPFEQFVSMVQDHFASQFGDRDFVGELIAERSHEAQHE